MGNRLGIAHLVAVVLLSAVVAGTAFWHYASEPDSRWRQLHHDRNTHYLQALQFAIDFRTMSPGDLLADLWAARTWPPLHNLASGATMAVAGIGPRVAVLPNVVAFALTACFAFLLARTIAVQNSGASHSDVGSNLAGWLAAGFVLASPAHRIYAVDVMLESFGACWTLASLWAWIAARQSGSKAAWRFAAFSLSALFLTKYNYWLLAWLAIAGGEFLQQPRTVCRWLWNAFRKGDWRFFVRHVARQPLTLPLTATLFATAYCLPRGGQSIQLFGHAVVIEDKCYNLLTLDLLLAMAWLAPWWFRRGRRRLVDGSLDPRLANALGALVHWHGFVVLGWLLLPKRLGYFVWYLSPLNGPAEPERAVDFLAPQWQWWTTHYHVGVWNFAVAAVLAAAAVAWGFSPGRAHATPGRRLGIGMATTMLLVSALLTIKHPQHSDRYSHTWIPALWVLAGAGVAAACATMPFRQGWMMPAAATLAVLAAQAPAMIQVGHSLDEGHQGLPSSRLLAAAILEPIEPGAKVALLGTQPFGAFMQWTCLERFGRRDRCQAFVKRFSRDAARNEELLAAWLYDTACDTIVTIEVPAGSPLYYPNFDHYRQYIDFMNRQTVFAPLPSRSIETLGCKVTHWTRNLRALAGPAAEAARMR